MNVFQSRHSGWAFCSASDGKKEQICKDNSQSLSKNLKSGQISWGLVHRKKNFSEWTKRAKNYRGRMGWGVRGTP
jgi:hypothetical protein